MRCGVSCKETCYLQIQQHRKRESQTHNRIYYVISYFITAMCGTMGMKKRSCERNYHRRNSRSGRNSLCRRITEQNEENVLHIEFT